MPETEMTPDAMRAYDEALRRIQLCGPHGTELELFNLGLTQLPPEIGQLRLLMNLSAGGNRLTSLPPEINQLEVLTELNLSHNLFSNLPPLAKTIKRLWLYNNRLENFPEAICQLSNLKHLSLSFNPVKSLPNEIGQLKSLESLSIGNTLVQEFPNSFRYLRRLKILAADNVEFPSLPDWFNELESLECANFSRNDEHSILSWEPNGAGWGQGSIFHQHKLASLRLLPISLIQLSSLKELYLHGNDELGIPPGILGHKWVAVHGSRHESPAKPKAILEYYFSQRSKEARPLNEVKLLLVGRGGAGKTSVVQRLIRGTFDKEQESTTGIALQDWTLPCPGGEPVTVHVWDFAGQVIAHATHQFFMSARSVYVLVLTAREDSQREDAEYWLRLIRAFGSERGADGKEKTSKVIVVLNKWATAPVRLDREALREKYPFIIGYVETDCESGLGIPALRELLAETIGHDAQVREKTGAAYFQVKNALKKRWRDERTNYLDYAIYEEVCAAAGVTDQEKQKLMAVNLHALGLALNYGDDPRLRDTTVLDPDWVTDGIYLLLREAPNERAELSLEAACRKLPKEEVKRVMFLIRLMQKYDLAFPLKEDELLWLVPQALADSQPALAAEWQGEATRLRWTYAALPEGLVPRFITRTHTLSEGLDRWLNGTLLELGQARALLRADVTDRRITATVLGPEPDRQQLAGTIQTEMRALNAEIRGLEPLEELQLQRAPEVWLPVTGLEKAEDKGKPEMSLLTPKGPIEVNATDENNRLTAEDARTNAWKPRVFISYSHHDDAAKDQLVLKLKVLQTAGLVEFWLDRDLTAGEEWNRGIREELESMDVFILLVSDHAMTSDYINRVEITRALERREEGNAEVVPVILHRCQWKACGRLNHLIALPKDGKPIKDHRPHADGWHDVSEGLLRVLTKLKQQHAGEHRSREYARGMR